MKSFNEIYQELKIKFPNISEKELVIKAREQYIFENGQKTIKRTDRKSINST